MCNEKINGEVKGQIPYSKTAKTTKIDNINVEGDVVIELIDETSNNRVSFDNLSWTCYEKLATDEVKKQNNKLVIYTAFTGNYDELKEPEFIDENCDYVCFTENPDLESDTWEIVQMEKSTGRRTADDTAGDSAAGINAGLLSRN